MLANLSSMLQNHPGGVEISGDVYASEMTSSVKIDKRNVYTGRYLVYPNNLTIPGTSTFVISPGTVVGQCFITCSIIMPQHARASDFWLYKLIDLIEIVVSGNSSIQSLQLSGESAFQAVICETDNKEKRDRLGELSPAFNLTGAGETVYASIPLHTFFSSPEMDAAFPLDSSTIASQIQINIRWKNLYQVVSGSTGNAVTLPTAFSSLYMRVNQLDNGQVMSRLLEQRPLDVYAIPGRYYQSYSLPVSVTHGSEFSIELSNIPSGYLQAILVTAIPNSWVGLSTTLQYAHPHSADFESLRLLKDGQELYRFDQDQEGLLIQCLKADHESGFDYNCLDTVSVAAAATNGLFNHRVYVIPFSNEVSECMKSKMHEHTSSYSGMTLNLYGTVKTTVGYNTSLIDRATLATPSPSTYTFYFTYVVASMVNINAQKQASLITL